MTENRITTYEGVNISCATGSDPDTSQPRKIIEITLPDGGGFILYLSPDDVDRFARLLTRK